MGSRIQGVEGSSEKILGESLAPWTLEPYYFILYC